MITREYEQTEEYRRAKLAGLCKSRLYIEREGEKLGSRKQQIIDATNMVIKEFCKATQKPKYYQNGFDVTSWVDRGIALPHPERLHPVEVRYAVR